MPDNKEITIINNKTNEIKYFLFIRSPKLKFESIIFFPSDNHIINLINPIKSPISNLIKYNFIFV